MKEHPFAIAVCVTIIAIGVLVILAPFVVEMLGFGELGPLEGMYSPFFLFFFLSSWCFFPCFPFVQNVL